jgi:putative DNA primase/helicase
MRPRDDCARRGRDVAIAMPPEEGQDFNDLLMSDGAEAVARVIAAAESVVEAETVMQIGQHRPLNYQGSGDTVPTLRADEGDLARANEQVWSLLMASNRCPWLFRLAGQPTWVVPDDEGRPVATALNEEKLRHMLARLARWVRVNAKGEPIPAPPPLPVVKSVLATPDPALPVLTGIVNTPVFGRNGTLLTTPGYHPDARLLYVPAPGFAVPDIPAKPTPAEIAAARTLICDDLLGDFPFTGDAERSHVVALLLLGFLRGMIDGPTPLHLIEKPAPGTGATLMVDAITDHPDRRGRERHDRGARRRGMAQARDREAPPDPLDRADRQPARHARQLGRGSRAHGALLGGPHPRPLRDGPVADPLPLDRHRQQSRSSPTKWPGASCASGSMPMSDQPVAARRTSATPI